jgi:general secretion pathway protein D
MKHHPFAQPLAPIPAAYSGSLRAKCFRGALLAFSLALLLHGACAYAYSANKDYKHGQQAEARQDYDTAYADYLRAAHRNPTDLRYRTALDRIRTTDATMHVSRGRKLLLAGNLEGALAEFLHASEIDPGNEAAQQEIARVREIQNGQPQAPSQTSTPIPSAERAELNSIGSPVQLKPISNEPLTLHMNEDTKVIYQAIGKAAGINVLFDPDYTSKRIQVDLNNVNLMDALRIVGAMSNTFWRPVTSNTIFVAQNTRVKRTELEEQAVQTFYLTNAWQQNDLNDVQTALRNVLPNAKVYGVASQNAIVMRGSPDELLLAQKLIDDLDKPRSEVVVDFGVLEVSKNWERTLGIAWPNSFGVQLQSPQANSAAAANSTTATGAATTGVSPTLYDLAHLNSQDFAVTVGSATLNLLLNDNQTQILQDPRIRATDGQKATLTIGSKIPIATGSYSAPGITPTAAIGYAQTQFQYIDVGVKIEVTPTVHYDNDVTLKVHIEISSQSGNVTIEGVTEPILSQRVADQVIRLKEGEASILGGILNNQNQMSWTGIPGLSSIPILKYLFGSKDHTINDDEIVFVVIPHVVRGEDLNQANLRAIDTGQGQSIELRHVSIPLSGTAPVARMGAPPVQPNYGVLAAGSASSAAMQALGQIRNSGVQTGNMQMPPPVSQPAHPVPAAPQGAAPPPTTAPPPTAPPPATTVPQATPPPPAAAGPGATAAPQAAAAANGVPSFVFQTPPGTVPAGASFQVPVLLNGGADVSSVPLQFKYDPSKLTLVNVTAGNFLSKDGQATALIHRDDGPGNVTIVASRPPGSAGVSGSGVLCVLTFQAKTAGASALTITRAGAVSSKQQQVAARSAQASIVVK